MTLEDCCTVEGCSKPKKGAKDICGMHVERLRKHGSLAKPTPSNVCNVPSCQEPRSSWARCATHAAEMLQAKWRKAFEASVVRGDGCWGWNGPISTAGYARVSRHYAHRLSHEWFIGPIPEGLQIDHLCRNRVCTNPAHLEAVTPRINTLRGFAPTAEVVRTNRCIRGHEFTEANTYYRLDGTGRQCRACHALRARSAA